MARRIVKEVKKGISYINIDGHLWDGYRGDRTLAWRLKRGYLEEFATVCKCGRWYGWSTNIFRIKDLYKKMKKHGCKKCGKK